MNSIARDVYVKRKALNSPISYVRATNAQELQFRFCDFAIPENTEARVYVQKPSGKAVYNNAVIEGDTVTVEVTTQMFSEVGQSYIQLHLVKGEKTLVTFTQTVDVLHNYAEGDAPESKNESGFFKEYEDRLDEAANAANTATAEVRKQMEEIAGAVEDATNAAGSANTAAGEANKAAEKAEKGASDAISAAKTATKATKAANDAAKKADEVKKQIQEKADNGEFTGTIKIGAVTTGEPGTQASVKNVGTDKDAVLDMTIPKGETGEVDNIDNVSLEFTEALERENIESRDAFKIIFGKIKKFFADLKTVAFTGDFADLTGAPKAVNNLESDSNTDYLAAAQGKEIKEQITELNKKLSGNYHTELKTVNIPPNSWTTMNSAILKDGIYDVKANVSYSVSNDSAATILAIETDPYTDTVSVRGNMGGGGGLYVSKLIDARNKDVTVSAKAFHSNVSASEATSLFSYIRLC